MVDQDVLRHIGGLVLALASFGAIGAGAWGVRRHYLPTWSGAPAALATTGTAPPTTEPGTSIVLRSHQRGQERGGE